MSLSTALRELLRGERARRYFRRAVVAAAVLLLLGYVVYWNMPLLVVEHLPERYTRRAGDLSANVTGWMPRFLVRQATFRLNGGPEAPVGQGWPRDVPPNFTIELPADQLKAGKNVLEIEAKGWLRPSVRLTREFVYVPDPIRLPLTVEWQSELLDVQDGDWETTQEGGETWVRPRPGTEDYDRILMATGSFEGDRRIETEAIFRHHTIGRFHKGAREYGFGVLSLWGGHPDEWSHRPRRGWSFALSWYWSKPGGIGNEISYRAGEGEASWVGGYRDFEVAPDVRYRIVVEVRRLHDPRGFDYFEQKTKWWRSGTKEPPRWMILDDRGGGTLPSGPYGIAVMAFNCQAEFGPVRVLPIEPGG
jgi:hypothetical protein